MVIENASACVERANLPWLIAQSCAQLVAVAVTVNVEAAAVGSMAVGATAKLRARTGRKVGVPL